MRRVIGYAEPVLVRFDTEGGSVTVSGAARGWNLLNVAGTAGVFAGTALLLALVSWLLTLLGRRSMLTGRIILNFVPVMLLVLAAAGAAALHLGVSMQNERQNDRLAAAARTAAGLLDGGALRSAALQTGGTEESRQALDAQLNAAAKAAEKVSQVEDVGLVLYVLRGEEYLCAGATNARDAFYSAAF